MRAGNATKRGSTPPPPARRTGPGTERPARPQRQRVEIPKGFTFAGCWHCKGTDHTRTGGRDGKGKRCPEFDKLLKAANPGVSDRKKMKLPAGYMGAYEKALIAAGGKPRRLNFLDDEDHDTEEDFDEAVDCGGGTCRAIICEGDSDSDDDFEIGGGRVCALGDTKVQAVSDEPQPTPPVATASADARILAKNAFAAIAEDDGSHTLDPAMMAALNGFAHKVSRKTNRNSKPVVVPKPAPTKLSLFDKITVRNEEELNQLLKDHPNLSTPADQEKRARKVLRSKPAALVCGPGEVLCLVDSGSTINAAWIEKHFPEYIGLIKQTRRSLNGDYATTAGGQKLYNKGTCDIGGTVEGMNFRAKFRDMEVEIPILSVRKIVKGNNDVSFTEDGGWIRNRQTGALMHFYEYEGVYFIKLRVDAIADLGFARPEHP